MRMPAGTRWPGTSRGTWGIRRRGWRGTRRAFWRRGRCRPAAPGSTRATPGGSRTPRPGGVAPVRRAAGRERGGRGGGWRGPGGWAGAVLGGGGPGLGVWARRSLAPGEKGKLELAFFRCWSPRPVTLAELAAVAGARWAVEDCFAEARNETGLDHYCVSCYRAWYGHATFSMLAHPVLGGAARAARPER